MGASRTQGSLKNLPHCPYLERSRSPQKIETLPRSNNDSFVLALWWNENYDTTQPRANSGQHGKCTRYNFTTLQPNLLTKKCNFPKGMTFRMSGEELPKSTRKSSFLCMYKSWKDEKYWFEVVFNDSSIWWKKSLIHVCRDCRLRLNSAGNVFLKKHQ